MKSIAIMGAVLAFSSLYAQQSKQSKQNVMNQTVTTLSSREVVQNFFTAFGNGDMEGLLNTFHENCTIIAIHEGSRSGNEIYGTYNGKKGVTEFVTNLGSTFNTKAFAVDRIVGEGNAAFANGKFTHEIKSTGRDFSSDWALMCLVEDGKIVEYHFYEDSAAFTTANRK